MSHISKTNVVFDSEEAIKEMCELLPHLFQFYDRKTFKSYGHADWKCDFCIGVTGAEYEIGFRRKKDGTLEPLLDWWASGGLRQALGNPAGEGNKDHMPVLKQAYAIGKTAHEAKALGHSVQLASMPNGKYKMMVAKKEHTQSWKWNSVLKSAFSTAKKVLTATAVILLGLCLSVMTGGDA